MTAGRLELLNFRSYPAADITFSPGMNVIYGGNGQGKTNLLEAVYLFCTGKSYRTAHDIETVRFGAQRARVRLSFSDSKRAHTAELRLGDKKAVSVNGVPVGRLSELVGMFRAVIFTPEHLGLIRGGPAARRQFLDVFISQWKPVYFQTLLSYYQVVRQRNSLLRQRPADLLGQLEIWNEKLYEYGKAVCAGREEALSSLNTAVQAAARDITAGKEEYTLCYQPSVKGDYADKEHFMAQLRRVFDQEVEKGVSLIGPHRDDFAARLGGRDLKKYGSQGQVRTCVLGLKLAECEMIAHHCGDYPVLLLDDMLSELDGPRQEYLLSHIGGRQVLLTHAGRHPVLPHAQAVFHVRQAAVVRER